MSRGRIRAGAPNPGRRAERAVPAPAYNPPVATWILTGSLENLRVNVERGFDVIGLKEGRRRQAAELEPGDEIVFYVTGVQAFGGIARVRSEMFEDRAPIWPQGTKRRPEPYPWRVEAEPVTVLDEDSFVPAEELAAELDHVRKWPSEHWHLAFQGQLRTVGEADAELLRERIEASARAGAAHG
ncbi:MAG: EVE domain-containing protein [Solirubrobacterales bacterium]|nr:EVE domain-containing protein [Solirubrobacterales bacterium]